MTRSLIGALLFALLAAPLAYAGPLYTAEAGALNLADHEAISDDSPVDASADAIETFTVGSGEHLGLGTWSGESAAAAGPGYLRGSSHTLLNITDHQASLGSGFRGGGTIARLVIDDVIISGPGSGTVTGTLNLHFQGSLAAGAHFANALGDSGSYAQVSIGVGLPGVAESGDARLGAKAPPTNELTLTNSGLLTGYGGGLLALHIDSASLPINTPFSIQMELKTETGAAFNVGGTGPNVVPISAEATSSFMNTLSFALDGPVFTLPDGYTVNSASGMIVENRFVPEPASALLLAPGLGLWLFIARRRRKGIQPRGG